MRLLGFLCVISLIVAAAAQPKPHVRTKRVRQEEWLHRLIVGSDDPAPPNARLKAIEQMREMERLSRAPGANPAWTSIGPKPIKTPFRYSTVSGRVTIVVADPRNNGVVYLGGAQGGVWKSVDSGSTWVPLTDNQPSLAIGALAIDPSNPNTIYAGTGEENFYYDSQYGAGILKSTDGGATWTQLPTGPFVGTTFFPPARIGQISVHPTNGNILLAAIDRFNRTTDAGVYRSTDAGLTWSQVLKGQVATDVVFDPNNGNNAYAGLAYLDSVAGVYKSTNAGATWTKLTGTGSNVLPTANLGAVTLGISRASSSTVYAAFENTGSTNTNGLLGLYKTVDGGANWTLLANTPNYCYPQCYGDRALGVLPTNANAVFVGGVWPGGANGPAYRSLDGGSTWQNIGVGPNGEGLHSDVHSFGFTPDGARMYAGNDGGISATDDTTAGTLNWTSLNATLTLAQYYPGISINPTNAGIAVGGTQDLGVHRYTGVPQWNETLGCDGGWTAIDPTNTNNVFASCDQDSGWMYRSTNGGQTWIASATGLVGTDNSNFIAPMVMDPSKPQTLYFGTTRVYQTTNGAVNWTPMPGLPFNNILISLAVSPADSNTVWAGSTAGKIAVSSNAGSGTSATWTNASTGLPARGVTQVVPDLASATTAYATFNGFSGFSDTLGHVFVTTNKGTTWKDISSNLPNTPVLDLAIDPDQANTLYIGTDIGVFWTNNGGQSWSPLNNGMPVVSVMSLRLHRASRTLRAATHGRGMFDISIPAGTLQPAPAFPSNGIVNGASFAQGQSSAAGLIGSLFGTSLAGSSGAAQSLPLPTILAGTTVTVNGVLAPLLVVSPQQINFLLPWETLGSTQATVVVTSSAGGPSTTVTIPISPVSPGLFATNSAGSGQGAILIANTSILAAPIGTVSGSRPASRGEFISIFASGLGDVTNRPANGAAAGSNSTTLLTPSVTIGGVNAPPSYSGLAPGFAGLYQINVQVPSTVTPGSSVTVIVKIGGVTSNTVTIAVQ